MLALMCFSSHDPSPSALQHQCIENSTAAHGFRAAVFLDARWCNLFVLKSVDFNTNRWLKAPAQLSTGAKITAKRVALYLRVSTSEQTTKNQRRELQAAAKWNVVAVFEYSGVSGAKGCKERPGLDSLLRSVARREFDIVAAWSVDRLGPSLQDLIATLGELHAKGDSRQRGRRHRKGATGSGNVS